LSSQAMKRLMEGNRRYVSGKSTLDISESRRIKVAYKQRPFAAVLSCADSRVPPEIIFDQGLGDLFVVRTAGSILDQAVLGSLEFCVAELHIPLVMVLGHTRCGAVEFAMEVAEGGRKADANMAFLADALKPSMENPQPAVKNAGNQIARKHIHSVVERLKRSPFLESAIQKGETEIVGGWYDLDAGTVEISME
jgi:carbonic anhydrase